MAKTIEQLEQENKKLREQTKGLSKKLAVQEATAPKDAKPTIEVDGEHYQVRSGERTKKGVTTREELAKDIKRCRELIAAGSGLLKKVDITK